jgi:hypothetical protein
MTIVIIGTHSGGVVIREDVEDNKNKWTPRKDVRESNPTKKEFIKNIYYLPSHE